MTRIWQGRNMNNYETSLYQSIFTLLDEQRSGTGSERRESDRHPYRCVQLMAPFDGENLPNQEAFRQVLCHDLSPSGFSYFCDSRPTERLLIVALGKVPLRFYVAEVVHTQLAQTEHGGQYHVGCRFVRRLGND